MRLVVGISGSTGVVYGIRLLQLLRGVPQAVCTWSARGRRILPW